MTSDLNQTEPTHEKARRAGLTQAQGRNTIHRGTRLMKGLAPFRWHGHAPAALTPEDQAEVDLIRAALAACRNPQPWTPGRGLDVAVPVGPFIERAYTRGGDDHGPDLIAVALIHPDTPRAAAYAFRYCSKGWLSCETSKIIGVWQPAYAPLTHAAAGLDLPDDVGMKPAHYAVFVEARKPDGTGYTLLRLGPYTQARLAARDADRLDAELEGRATTVLPGYTVTARNAPFDVSDHKLFIDPYEVNTSALLTATLDEVSVA